MLLLRQQFSTLVACGLLCSSTFAGGVAANHGLDDLILRLGAGNEPTGFGVPVSQVEADDGGNYGPDTTHSDFAGKSFTYMSGSTGISGHATNIGRRVYGSGGLGLAPGIENAYIYSAAGWVQSDFLKVGTGSNPLSPPGGVTIFNNSWLASFGNISIDSQALRRADWVTDEHDALMINGVANSGDHAPLMTFGFNGISVGMQSGDHTSGVVPSGYDSSGCQIPLIVAVQSTTSSSTGVVSAATALLVETSRTHPNNAGNYFASFSETRKSCLLVGGKHLADWTNNAETSGVNRGRTSQPIDSVFGVGTVNVDRSWQSMAGGQHDSSSDTIDLVAAPYAGWETWLLAGNQSRYIKFEVASLADEVSILLTWHQSVSSNFESYSIANLDLILWKSQGGKLLGLTGDAGIGVFGGGNVVSESDVDNVEHLYIQDLAAGEYILEIKRVDSSSQTRVFSVAWLFPELDIIFGDVNGDGVVNVNDILMLIVAWGPCDGCIEDLNGDGTVNVTDLVLLISYW
jgi:hypothetical protein